MRKGQKTVGPALSIGRGSIAVGSPPGRTTIATNNGNQHIISSITSAVSVASSRAGSHLGGSRPPVDQRGLAAACQFRVCVRAEALQRVVLPALGARWPRHDPSAQLPGLGRTLIVGWLAAPGLCDDDGSRSNHKSTEQDWPALHQQQRQHRRDPQEQPPSQQKHRVQLQFTSNHIHTHAYIINYRKMSLQKARKKEQSNENTRGISRK